MFTCYKSNYNFSFNQCTYKQVVNPCVGTAHHDKHILPMKSILKLKECSSCNSNWQQFVVNHQKRPFCGQLTAVKL